MAERTASGRPMMKRQYSVSSEDALRKLSDCEQRLKDFEDRFSQYVFAATTDQNKDTLVAMKNDLAVMVGEVDKLQMVEIDGVNTMDLRSGQEDARASRKYLNSRTGTLADRMSELHAAINTHLDASGAR